MARDTRLQVILDAVDKATAPLKTLPRALGRTAEVLTASQHQRQRLNALNNAAQPIATPSTRASTARETYQRGVAQANALRHAGDSGLAIGRRTLNAGRTLLAPGIAWGEQMSAVRVAGRFTADDPRFTALQQQSRDLGRSTPFSAQEIGAGQTFMLRAGLSAEAIQASMKDVLNLSVANTTELNRAAGIATDIADGFGVDLEQAGGMTRVADVLSATANRAHVDLQTLGDTMASLGAGSGLGLTLEQAGALAGQLVNLGLEGDQAGETLQTMMRRLTAPTAAASAVMADLGLRVADAEGNLRPLPAILRDLDTATADMSRGDRANALETLLNADPGTGLATLVRQMSAGPARTRLPSPVAAQGDNAALARLRTDNLAGDLDQLRSAWDGVSLSLTTTVEGPLRELVQTLTDITRGVDDWIQANPQLAGTLVEVAVGLRALITVWGALMRVLAPIVRTLAMVRYGLTLLGLWSGALATTLGQLAARFLPMLGNALLWLGRLLLGVGRLFLLNPIGLAVTAIAGAAYLIYRYWAPISTFFSGLWQQVRDAFNGGIGAIATLLLNWNPLGLIYQGIVTVLDTLGIEIPERLSSLGSAIVSGLSAAWEGLGNLWRWFREAPGRAIDAVASMVGEWDLMGQLREKWTGAISYLKSLPSQMLNAGREVAAGLGEGIKHGAQAVADRATSMAHGTIANVRGVFDSHSPSRVFRAIGLDVTTGLQQGLQRHQQAPIREAGNMASRITRAGAGIALGAMALPAAALPAISQGESIRFDARPPLATGQVQSLDQRVTVGDIHITAAPGMDERQLAQFVSQEVQRALESARRDQNARRRSSLWDQD